LAQIRRAGDGGPQLDEKYVPPLLTIDAWPPLANKIVRRLYDQIGNKIDQYAEYVDTQEISWPSPDPSEGQWLVMLSYLSEAYAALHALVFARGVHPFTAYRELCRIVGRLSVFEPSRRPPEDLPRYDHENLGPIFGWFRDTIERLLDAPQPRYQKRYFFGAKHGMQVAIDSDWFAPGWEWYVGVWHGHLSAEQCIALLQPNRFFWKLGSIELVDTLFVDRVPGLRFDAVTLPPPALPKRKEWTYFKVSREPRAAWEAVQAHATLGMRYQDELIQNRDRLEGQRTLLVNAGALGLVKLEFALFAIPPSR
jgi:type VI secretion system protein ImpJ